MAVVPLLDPLLLEPLDPELDMTPELDVTPELDELVTPELEPLLVVPELLPVPLLDFPLLDRPASSVDPPLLEPL